MQVGRESAPGGVPAFPGKTFLVEPRLDYTVGQVMRIEWPANPVGKEPAVSGFT
jgi:hypothetical protein